MSAPDLRDRGLRRVSRLTGWLAAAGLVAVGAFAGLLARPQHTSTKVATAADPASAAVTQTPTAGSAGTTANGSKKSTTTPGSTKKTTPQVTRPVQPPVQSRQRGPAVSGGS
jgi:hypothetical protein